MKSTHIKQFGWLDLGLVVAVFFLGYLFSVIMSSYKQK